MRALAVLLSASLAIPAAAQVRTIPQDARLAEIRHVQANVVELNGRQVQLAPGAQIRDTSNRIIMPVALPAGALVKYRLNELGQVHDIWLVTRQELTR
jgi:predicted 2-oxoglutarate/Fe(II)-dependent dioxygenase YbiX